MHETLPIYCETALHAAGAFPAEPVNAATSLIPVILGALALVYLIRQRQPNHVAYALAALTILTGAGSVAWHAVRDDITLFLDALPGMIYFVMLLFFWPFYLRLWYVGLGLLAGIVGLMVFVSPGARDENQIVIVIALAAVAVGLLLATWLRNKRAFTFASVMVGGAAIAFVLRSIDLSTCDTIPVGTHFFWHFFLASAAYAGVRLIAALKNDRSALAAENDARRAGA